MHAFPAIQTCIVAKAEIITRALKMKDHHFELEEILNPHVYAALNFRTFKLIGQHV